MLPKISILNKGYFKWIKKNTCIASSNVVLIQDKENNILIDTGSIKERKNILNELEKKNLKPKNINIVIITHWHPDHIGCNFLFKKACFIDSFSEIKRNKYSFYENDYIINEYIKIIKTPGHSDSDCSVIIKTKKGIISVVGDLFWKDKNDKLLFINNKYKLNKSREKILEVSDYIIAGHSKVFKV